MTNQKKSGGTKVVAFILAAAIMGVAFAGTGGAATNICQTALEKCLLDVATGGIGELLGAFITVASCLAGYDFCRKYILPLR